MNTVTHRMAHKRTVLKDCVRFVRADIREQSSHCPPYAFCAWSEDRMRKSPDAMLEWAKRTPYGTSAGKIARQQSEARAGGRSKSHSPSVDGPARGFRAQCRKIRTEGLNLC